MRKFSSNDSYQKFSEEDFLCDPAFQDWVIRPTQEDEDYWRQFLLDYPEKKALIENAHAMLKQIAFRQHIADDKLIKDSFKKHLDVIEELESGKVISINRNSKWVRKLLTVAAVITGIILSLFAFYKYSDPSGTTAVYTAYGKIDTLILPDHSLVVLNANSKIQYRKKWNKKNKRELWLEGEAFFDVRHLNHDINQISGYDQFIVHTKDLEVEVLGTSFDIRQRRETTEIVLEKGEIKISFKDKQYKDIFMKPGDIIIYNTALNKVEQNTVIPQEYTAWKEKKLLLKDPVVNEILGYLEDNFGKKIILEDPKLGTKRIEGPILLNNLDDALFILSTVLNTDIIKSDSTLIIKPR